MSEYPQLKIEEFCLTGSGGTPSRTREEYYGGSIPWVKSGELRESLITETEEMITERAINESSAKIVPKGSILLAMYGATVGRMAFLGVDAATNQAVCNIRPDLKRADPKYVFHCLQSRIGHFLSRAAGGAQPNISQGIVRETEIPLPPLDEQRRIAAILDKADDLRRKRKRALELLDGLTQSIFLQMSNSDSQKLRIGEFARIQGGKRLPKGHDYCREETGYKYLRVTDLQEPDLHRTQLKNLREETFQSIRRYIVNEDDVVITIAGTIGVTRHIDAELAGVNLTENAAKIVIHDQDRIDPVYLSWTLRSEGVQSQIRTSTGQVTIGKLALFRIEQLEIDVPKIEQQRQFRHILEEQQKIRRIAALALGNIDSLFSSLQSRAFSGQL